MEKRTNIRKIKYGERGHHSCTIQNTNQRRRWERRGSKILRMTEYMFTETKRGKDGVTVHAI